MLTNIYSIVFLIFLAYFMLMLKLRKGWRAIPYFITTRKTAELTPTIIVAFKNEENALPKLLKTLKKQSYQNFELILVDDYSEDSGKDIAQSFQADFLQLQVIENQGKGKKQAIKTAIYNTENELIITIDADSRPGERWLETIVNYYVQTAGDLIICPVMMVSDGSFLQDFQQLEFMSLVASGAGAAGANMPIFCNGANLAFKRTAWLASEDELHFDEPSGDDVFLLQSIKSRFGKINFLKSKHAVVQTEAKNSWSDFFRQRSRWAAKKAMYSDSQLSTTALIVFLTSILLFSLIISAAFIPTLWLTFVLIFFGKYGIDLYFLFKPALFFGKNNFAKSLLIFSFIYPFYILISAFSALFRKDKSW